MMSDRMVTPPWVTGGGWPRCSHRVAGKSRLRISVEPALRDDVGEVGHQVDRLRPGPDGEVDRPAVGTLSQRERVAQAAGPADTAAGRVDRVTRGVDHDRRGRGTRPKD